ncbi:MAG: tRNA uridine-5-carboxymethylaminomethyl(34) synthesis GTPase MnmE [Desulfobulbaceae bacterium]|nr:MAG: tRNA uridine-5-carboxymethylaminomethyl(34) synthesis GTPase MnmE [Desulfobulbaceae bacterium]
MPADTSEQTIAAISTPPGSGGIGIIRISGGQALPALQRVFRPHDPACQFRSHQLYYGRIVDPGSDRILDEVLAVFMRAPRTYTREDVVEIHCHGSYLLLSRILEVILAEGVRLAEPGEFTKRAFLNGRIDLTRAEAVIDILSAKTRRGIDQAQAQLAGALYQRIEGIRQGLLQMKAYIEVAIDFPDEDVEIADHAHLGRILEEQVAGPLQRLLDSAEQGRIVREGISVVIAGVPNVGKSSLLNALLQEERALVTAIPGTTRDSIEEYLDIEGMPVRIVDTAGIREHAEEVEELGIQRAKQLMQQADLVLFLLDGSRDPGEADLRLYRMLAAKPMIVVMNKIDLCREAVRDFAGHGIAGPVVQISARHQTGIDELKKAIFATVVGGREQWQEDACAPNLRHRQALLRAHEASCRIAASMAEGSSCDLIAVDIQECLDQLAEIVGLTTADDVLDLIFTQFCLGK